MGKIKKLGIGKYVSHYSYILVFVAIFGIFAITSNGLNVNGVMNIFRHSAVIGILGFGMGMVCLTGEIDLSVGSMLALVSGCAVMIFNATGSIILTLLFSMLFGMALGFINGFLVGKIKMPAFIVTLATMLIFRSLAQWICRQVPKELIGGGSSVYKMNSSLDSYQSLYSFGNGTVLKFPVVGIVLLLVTVIAVIVSTNTKYGKKVYAVGSNDKAAHMAGINVPNVKISVFVISGLMVGVASFLWVSMNGSSDPATTGNSNEMYAIAAVVLGGISMAGGKGKCLGVLFGAMSYTVIDKIIVALKMDSLINDTIKGAILILVIFIQCASPQIKAYFAAKKKAKLNA